MGKFLRFLILAILIAGLTAGTALAGTVKVNHGADNTAYTAATEAMTAARNVIILSAANGPVSFRTTQDITSANFLSVSLTGAAFTGGQYRICNAGNAASYGVGSPASGATAYNFQLNFAAANAISAGNTIYLTSDAACQTAAAQNLDIRLSATSSATNPSITMAIVSAGNIPVDPSSSAQLANISAEYAVANTSAANAHTVDYLGAPGTGVNFSVEVTGANNNTAGSVNALAFNRTTKNYGAINGTIGGAASTVSGFVSITDALAWSGVSKVFINTLAAYNCADNAAGNNVGTGTLTSGTINLAIPAAAYNGLNTMSEASNAASKAAVPVNVCVVGNGTTALAPRVLTIAGAVNATSFTGATSAASTFDTWTLNAYQTWISWMVNASTVPTYCLINNADTARTVSVLLDVVSGENAVVLTNQNMGTIAAKTSTLATFTGDSASLAGGTAVSLSTLGADKRYSTKLTVTSNPANISVQCIQTDPVTGAKRTVNSLQNGGTWTF